MHLCVNMKRWISLFAKHLIQTRSPDEVQRMKDIGNARADSMYGSSNAMNSLPSPDASHNKWLEFFRDKYERRRWAEVIEVPKKNDKCTKSVWQKDVVTGDVLGLLS